MNGIQLCQNLIKIIHSKSLKFYSKSLKFYFTTTRVWNHKFQIIEDKYR